MNNRELATFILIGVVLVFMVLRRDLRSDLGGALKMLLTPKLSIPLLIFTGWTALTVLVARHLGIWTWDLAASTVLWFLFVGMVWFMHIKDAGRDRDFLKRRVVEAVSIGALFEFFINLEVMPLAFELIFQVVLIFVVMLDAYARSEDTFKPVARLTTGLLALFTLGLTLFSAQQLISEWDSLALQDIVNQFILPLWLTVAALPCIYLIALYAGYESLLGNMKFSNNGRGPSALALTGVVTELKGSLVDISEFHGIAAKPAAKTSSFREARQAMRDSKRKRSEDRAARMEARERLAGYAGVPGVDSDGLVLDRREFAETKSALSRVATCHMGWYRNEDRPNTYRADLLDALGDFIRQGLPEDHGIRMRVRWDGQAWYAYRVTPSGHVFAAGADSAPPSQWFYDGAHPPSGFPSSKGGWTSFLELDRPEWREEPPTD